MRISVTQSAGAVLFMLVCADVAVKHKASNENLATLEGQKVCNMAVHGATAGRCRQLELKGNALMRWIICIFVLLVVVLSCVPTLRRWGLGRLPGDINFTVMGRKVEIPLMSTILLTAIVAVVARLL